MTTDKKLYAALAVLLALGGATFLQQKKQNEEASTHSYGAASEALPKVSQTKDGIAKIDKVTIARPAEGDGGAPTEVVLVKKDNTWRLSKPVDALAHESNVKSMLDALERFEVKERIDPSKNAYDKFGVSDAKATHVVFSKGAETVLDLYAGQDGSRGQMVRLGGRDGVWALEGYSSFIYKRSASDWRDKTVMKFEEKDARRVEIQNEHGLFVFERDGESWKGTLAAAEKPKKGSTAQAAAAPKLGKPKSIERFDPKKVDDLLRAYKALNATDFGDGKQPAEVGLATPAATLTIQLKEGTATHVLSVGDSAEGSNRWAKKNGIDAIFSIGSWSADWVTAAADKFQQAPAGDKDKGNDGDKGGDAPGAPGGDNEPPSLE